MLGRVLQAAILYVITLVTSWFGGRKSAQNDTNVIRLDAVRAANEVENEVEAMDRAALKRRASAWVRGPER
jgi:hypothetical protein